MKRIIIIEDNGQGGASIQVLDQSTMAEIQSGVTDTAATRMTNFVIQSLETYLQMTGQTSGQAADPDKLKYKFN